jgi:hypothetical protein
MDHGHNRPGDDRRQAKLPPSRGVAHNHLMELDHTQLPYRYGGRDFRLTEVHGRIVNEVLS